MLEDKRPANRGSFKKGNVPWNKGKKRSGYEISRMRKTAKRNSILFHKLFGPMKVPYRHFDINRKFWQFWKPKYVTLYRWAPRMSPKWRKDNITRTVKFRRYSQLDKKK